MLDRNSTRAGGEAEPSAAAWGGTAAPPCSTLRLTACRRAGGGRTPPSTHLQSHSPSRCYCIHARETQTGEKGRDRKGKGGEQEEPGDRTAVRGAWGRRKGCSLCREDLSLSPSFPPRKKKGRLFPAWIFFPVSPATAGETPSQATPSPWQRAERNRWSWRAKSQFEGERRRGVGQGRSGPWPHAWGDREVAPLVLLSLVLRPWRDISRLGATSGWPRRREGHACSPPKGHEPSETHHPMTWTSLAMGRAMLSQRSGASPCPPLAKLTP